MIRPLRDRIVVKPQVREISALIHVQNKEKFNEGTIVACGPKAKSVAPGDFIKYGNGTYLDWPVYTFDGQDYQISQEADVACVVDPD